ncbi:MAG: YjbQ family protein [Saprospiraceae bacterium]|nr:YjbQ family protein [Saprospiraceae bacterium]
MVSHHSLRLSPKSRGFHIVTREILNELPELPENGILNLFIQHTSAGLTINEAADPDVLVDFESIYNKLVPENMPFLMHTIEGPDDMPAHIKASMVGSSVSIPIIGRKLSLGTWQGIYLCEFRNRGGSRKIVASIYS